MPCLQADPPQQKLTYNCLCEDGSTPDLAEYKDTLPDRVCQANFAGCIKAHPNDAVGQGKCKTDIQNTCGTLSITDYEKGSGSGSGSGSDDDETSSGSASETAAPSSTGGSGGAGGASETTGGSTPSSTEGSAPAATSSDSAAVAMINGMDVGAGVLAAGLLGVFGYVL